jgi:hypothetical protein
MRGPPLPLVSDSQKEQAKTFYTAVGQGISHWSKMEGQIVRIVAKLLGTAEEQAGLVMYSINNFYTWIDIIDQLFVLDNTSAKSHKAWAKLNEKLKKENCIRVRLAHHSISQETEFVEGMIAGFQAHLRPPQLDMRQKSKPHALKPLTICEIDDFSRRVNDLHNKITALLKLMDEPSSSR